MKNSGLLNCIVSVKSKTAERIKTIVGFCFKCFAVRFTFIRRKYSVGYNCSQTKVNGGNFRRITV